MRQNKPYTFEQHIHKAPETTPQDSNSNSRQHRTAPTDAHPIDCDQPPVNTDINNNADIQLQQTTNKYVESTSPSTSSNDSITKNIQSHQSKQVSPKRPLPPEEPIQPIKSILDQPQPAQSTARRSSQKERKEKEGGDWMDG